MFCSNSRRRYGLRAMQHNFISILCGLWNIDIETGFPHIFVEPADFQSDSFADFQTEKFSVLGKIVRGCLRRKENSIGVGPDLPQSLVRMPKIILTSGDIFTSLLGRTEYQIGRKSGPSLDYPAK